MNTKIKYPIFDLPDVHAAFSAYEEAKSNWNGDDDGPMDRAEDRLAQDLQNAFKKVYEQGFNAGIMFSTETIQNALKS